jgi:hypothetical protein
MEKSSPTVEPRANDTNLSEEITEISNDIDAILQDAASSPEIVSAPNPPSDLAMMNTTSREASSPMSVPLSPITIDYPARMAVYKKNDAWTPVEIAKRSGSGITKNIEATLLKEALELTLDLSSPLEGMQIEYRTAKKEGSEKYFLIPTIRYKNSAGSFNSPLVSGFILD